MIQQQRQSNEVLRIFTHQSQAHSEQQTMMQQQIHALIVQQQQQMQIFMGMLSKKYNIKYTFFYKKTIFCLSLNFLNKMLEIRLRFS